MKNFISILIIMFSIIAPISSYSESDIYKRDELFHSHGSVMLILDSDSGKILDANKAAQKFYGYSLSELKSMNISQINILDEKEIKAEMQLAKNQERTYFEFKHKLKNGEIKYVEVYSSPIFYQNGDEALLSIVHDISPRVLAENQANRARIGAFSMLAVLLFALAYISIATRKNSKKEIEIKRRFQSLFDNMNEGFALHEIICDEVGKPIDYRFLEANKAFEIITGLKIDELKGKTVKQVLPKTEQYWIDLYGKVALTGEPNKFQHYARNLMKYFSVNVYSPKLNQFATVFSDVTEEVNFTEKIRYLSFHDQLTGLYNRHFFEEELLRLDTERNLPLTIALLDVNGLKLTNDAFGHKKGDELLVKVAEHLKTECRFDDIIARIGGDEFVILLPKTSEQEASNIIERIYASIENTKMDNIIISVSIGFDTKTNATQPVSEIFSKAEEHMYRKKLTESQSMRNKTISLILQTLNQADSKEKRHSENVSKIAVKIGELLNLNQQTLKEIELAGLMHDIGKIAINNEVLTKFGIFSESEMIEIRRHPEIGYHILKSVDEYAPLAECALSHHERWDGTGYPRGLKQDEIPFIARIIQIADAFDAMTSFRSYKETLSIQEALEEIKNNSGTQFDPGIVKHITSDKPFL